MELVLVGVFMVEHEQGAPTVLTQRKVMHAVVVHARLCCLLVGRIGGVGPENRQLTIDAGRVAPAIQHLELVLGRNPHRILQRGGH